MSPKKKNDPFNLLYKVEIQKTFIDKLYDFTVGPGRAIVIFVMLIIIVVFAFRFPIDAKLNDLIKESKGIMTTLGNIRDEAEFTDDIQRIKALKTYTTLYKSDVNSIEGQYPSSTVTTDVVRVSQQFGNKIVILNYNFLTSNSSTTMQISGASEAPEVPAVFAAELRKLSYVSDLNTSTSSEKGSYTTFSITLKLK